jgi:hypothetical protein
MDCQETEFAASKLKTRRPSTEFDSNSTPTSEICPDLDTEPKIMKPMSK